MKTRDRFSPRTTLLPMVSSLQKAIPMDSVILIIGGSGFLGQHLVRVFEERGKGIKEIRILDKEPYKNKFAVSNNFPVTSIIGDITQIDNVCIDAFKGVDSVFHCAALVSYQFPANDAQLYRNNVEGTKNVIDLCLESGVQQLIYTSTSEVSVKPYFRKAFFSIVVNETESTGVPPDNRDDLVFGQYAWTKLQAERLVLAANGRRHKSGSGILRTVSLRPPILYGEHDRGFIPLLMNIGLQLGNTLPRLGGPGGRHQLCYAGNVAWAHLCALDTLRDQYSSVGGLPIYITDDTYIYDQLRFCSRMSAPENKNPTINISGWYIPAFLCFLIALLYEQLYTMVDKYYQLPENSISPKALVTYMGSVVVVNRLRATIRLDYRPIYEAMSAMQLSNKYYYDTIRNQRKLKQIS